MKINTCHPERPYYSNNLCRNCYEKQLRRSNLEYYERQKKNARDWSEANKEQKSKVNKAYQKRKPTSRLVKRESFLRKKYNLTLEMFDKILEFQKNKCYICEQALKDGDRFLHIDHCHKTGKIRGILCSQCNWFMSKIDGIEKCLNNLNNYVKNQGSLWEKQEDIIKEKIDMN